MSGFVYAFTNRAMPGLVKIGWASDVKQRRSQLSNTSGVPVSFDCLYASEVKDAEDAKEKEKIIHEILEHARFNVKREFFRTSGTSSDSTTVKTVVGLLKLVDLSHGQLTAVLQGEFDNLMTPEERKDIDSVAKANARRRSIFTFTAVGILPGAELVYKNDATKVCVVDDERHVKYEETRYTLSRLAGKFLQDADAERSIGKGVNGTLFFLYNNELLSDLRDRLEEAEEEAEEAEEAEESTA